MIRPESELEPERELDLALAPCEVSNDPGRAGKVTALENDQLGYVEVRVIEDVDETQHRSRRGFRLAQRNTLRYPVWFAFYCVGL